MPDTSRPRLDSQTQSQSQSTQPPRRPRGRPRGSRNRRPEDRPPPSTRPPGRPRGSGTTRPAAAAEATAPGGSQQHGGTETVGPTFANIFVIYD